MSDDNFIKDSEIAEAAKEIVNSTEFRIHDGISALTEKLLCDGFLEKEFLTVLEKCEEVRSFGEISEYMKQLPVDIAKNTRNIRKL